MQEPSEPSSNDVSGADGKQNDGPGGAHKLRTLDADKVVTGSDKEKLLEENVDHSVDENGDDEISVGATQEVKGKSTLFNLRLNPKGKRLSDKYEEEDDNMESSSGQPQRPPRKKSGTKAPQIEGSSETDQKLQSFEFVTQKARKFGFGTSFSDANLEEYDVDEESNASDKIETTDHQSVSSSKSGKESVKKDDKHKDSPSKSQSDKHESHVTFSLGKPEQANRSFLKEKLGSPLRKKRTGTPEKKSERSPLLGKSAHHSSPAHSIDSSLLQPAANEEDNQNATLPSPVRSEDSSEDDSQYLNTSEEADQVLSPSIQSDDVVGVCSKYSQLSEDGSSPSSPTKSAVLTGEEELKEEPEAPKERLIFEPALQLGVAFTEFVDIDGFKESLGNKNPHTEDGFGGKSEEHLLILLRGGSNKGLKSYLRNSQWPAESDARRRLWENLCTHLLKAGGHFYEEIVEELFPQGSGDDVPLPTFVDLEHVHSYFLTVHGTRAVQIIMQVISNLSPDIIYCPMLYPLASLFLHYMSPEACFNCMQALLTNNRPFYLTQAKVKTEASKYVLKDLSKKYTKQAYVLMVRSAKSVESVFDNWMWWIFRDLPFQYLVRIIDSYLLEGYKVLYRVTLAIVLLFAKDTSQRGNRNSPVTNISAAISRFCRNMPFEPSKLIKVGFGIRGLTRKEIAKLHDKNEAYLRTQPSNQNAVTRVVSSQSMAQVSIARSFQGPMHLRHCVSNIFSPEMLQTIWSWIPMRLSLKRPKMLFSSDEHGTALRTLYMKSEHAPQTLLAIKTTSDEIFGAYCSAPWYTRHEKNKPHTSFFGTGETFVFSLLPEVQKYPWTGALGYPPEHTADHFMAGDDHMLIVGSGNGEAIYLDTFMNRCVTTHCDTFDNAPLCSETDFSCRVVEVFTFID